MKARNIGGGVVHAAIVDIGVRAAVRQCQKLVVANVGQRRTQTAEQVGRHAVFQRVVQSGHIGHTIQAANGDQAGGGACRRTQAEHGERQRAEFKKLMHHFLPGFHASGHTGRRH